MGGVESALEVEHIRKQFGEARVLDDVSLRVRAGEVHALLGENGAGKSTLIRIVAGALRPDAGSVSVGGVRGPFATPREASRHGVATLHQELGVVGGLSVAENVLLGEAVPHRAGLVRWRALRSRAAAVFEQLDYAIDVRRDAATLTPIEQTMTALARALSRAARLLILDEPTAALTDAERTKLFAALRRVAKAGVGIVYVSHRLAEVFDLADTYTVLRNGAVSARGTIGATSPDDIVMAMTGRRIDAIYPPRGNATDDVVVEVAGATGHRVRRVDLYAARGEIVGIAGLAGSGRSELLRLIAGVQRGTVAVRLDGEPVTMRSPQHAHRHGVVYVPQERRTSGLVPDSVSRNLNLTTLHRHVSLRPLTSPAKERRHAAGLWDRFGVRGSSLAQAVLNLSGGNQQKVVIAKYLALQPRLVLLDEPTRGVDVGTKSELYRTIAALAAAGAAVVVVSSDLPELIGLCHRVIVLHEGRARGEFHHADFDEHELLRCCYGAARA